MITEEKLEQLQLNIVQGASIVESNRDDLLELFVFVDQLEQEAGARPAGPNWRTVDELRAGVRSAPAVETVFNHKLHLLMVLDAIDKLRDAIAAKSPAEPLPEPEPATEA